MEKLDVREQGWSANTARGPQAAAALLKLYVRLAEESDAETSCRLATMALDMTPSSIEALQLLEQHAFGEHREELRRRYEAFLREVPFHPASARVQDALIQFLLERGQYDAALVHVGAYRRGGRQSLLREEILRACEVQPEEGLVEVTMPAEELVLDFEPFEPVYEVDELEVVEVERWERAE
jgi:hypothetical protein